MFELDSEIKYNDIYSVKLCFRLYIRLVVELCQKVNWYMDCAKICHRPVAKRIAMSTCVLGL